MGQWEKWVCTEMEGGSAGKGGVRDGTKMRDFNCKLPKRMRCCPSSLPCDLTLAMTAQN